jgi:hypothetical protein
MNTWNSPLPGVVLLALLAGALPTLGAAAAEAGSPDISSPAATVRALCRARGEADPRRRAAEVERLLLDLGDASLDALRRPGAVRCRIRELRAEGATPDRAEVLAEEWDPAGQGLDRGLRRYVLLRAGAGWRVAGQEALDETAADWNQALAPPACPSAGPPASLPNRRDRDTDRSTPLAVALALARALAESDSPGRAPAGPGAGLALLAPIRAWRVAWAEPARDPGRPIPGPPGAETLRATDWTVILDIQTDAAGPDWSRRAVYLRKQGREWRVLGWAPAPAQEYGLDATVCGPELDW